MESIYVIKDCAEKNDGCRDVRSKYSPYLYTSNDRQIWVQYVPRSRQKKWSPIFETPVRCDQYEKIINHGLSTIGKRM